jgi:hypothetical protein
MWWLVACREGPPPARPVTTPVETPAPPPSPTTPTPTTPPPPALEVEAGAATALGTTGLSVNARVHPHGVPTRWWIEHGPTSAYGAATAAADLGPALGAHYVETWDTTLGGWSGGSGQDLVHVEAGGAAGGFARYAEPTGTDYNHVDGIGLLHLAQYFYPGRFEYTPPSARLGGGDADLTDAVVELLVRGEGWAAYEDFLNPAATPFDRGDELVWWSQVDASAARDFSRMSNWAHTGCPLTAALYTGRWERVSCRLEPDTTRWTYAGSNRSQGRDVYGYHPLGDVLRHTDVDVFHVIVGIDDAIAMLPAIGFDELHVTYRDRSLLAPSTGTGPATAPPGSPDDAAALTDGWRWGEGRAWRSPPDPVGPVTLRWTLPREVVVDQVQLHNHPEWPSTEVEVRVSTDGSTWTPLAETLVPASSPHGPNFAFAFLQVPPTPASHVEVSLLGGVRPEAWGLGEVALFGSGAVWRTDDDWCGVTADLGGYGPGDTVHWRVVAEQGGRRVTGPDQVFVTPTGDAPLVTTGGADGFGRLLRLRGVVNTLGGAGWWSFELGPDAGYGHRTKPMPTGPELTPRDVSRILDFEHPALAAFAAGDPVHYRLAFCEGCDTPEPGDDRWTTGADATSVAP